MELEPRTSPHPRKWSLMMSVASTRLLCCCDKQQLDNMESQFIIGSWVAHNYFNMAAPLGSSHTKRRKPLWTEKSGLLKLGLKTSSPPPQLKKRKILHAASWKLLFQERGLFSNHFQDLVGCDCRFGILVSEYVPSPGGLLQLEP